jgi:hypothetical protein
MGPEMLPCCVVTICPLEFSPHVRGTTAELAWQMVVKMKGSTVGELRMLK